MKRNSTVEMLRILSMLFIILFHFCGRELGLFGGLNELQTTNNIGEVNYEVLTQLILHSLGQAGVPIFLFISGYYGMHYKKDRLIDMLLQCFLYTFVFYILASFAISGLGSFRMSILQFFGISQLWYIYSYIILYIFSDAFNQVINNWSRILHLFFVGLFLFITIGLWIAKEGCSNVTIMIEYYIVGQYVRKYMTDTWKSRMKWFILPSLLLFLTPTLLGFFTDHVAALQVYVNKYTNPFLLLLAMTLVVSADYIKTHSSLINTCASSVLAVYIIHEGAYLPKIFKPLFGFESYNLPRIILVAICIFILATLIDKARMILTKNIYQLICLQTKKKS